MNSYKSLRLSLLCLALMIANELPAQSNVITLSGRVSDLVSGVPLPEVSIYVTDLRSGTVDSVATNGFGYWQYDLVVTSVSEHRNVPSQFAVSPNYPNPFNPATRFEITMPRSEDVTITIFNTLGERIASRRKFLAPGTHSFEWQAQRRAGLYFVRVSSKSGTITRKMTQLAGETSGGTVALRAAPAHESPTLKLERPAAAIPVRIQAAKFGYVSHVLDTTVAGGEHFEFRIETIHSASMVADLHNDILEKMIDDPGYHLGDFHQFNHTDIPRLQTGGVDVQFFVVWVNPNTHGHDSYDHARAMIKIFDTELAANTSTIGQARTASEALDLNRESRIAAVLSVEGGHAIENDLAKLIALYDAGMRYLTITWNNSTDWAVSAQDNRSTTVGLSAFGREVITTLDSLGVIIDVSHTGIKTIEDILSITQNPIVATHSGARALRNHYRNLYDHQIDAIAATGGVIGVVFYPPFLSSSGTADIARVADHIDHIVELVGVDHAALGSDFDGIGTNTVRGLDDVTKFPDLTLELLRRGYSRAEVEQILGGNVMRVFEQVCGE